MPSAIVIAMLNGLRENSPAGFIVGVLVVVAVIGLTGWLSWQSRTTRSVRRDMRQLRFLNIFVPGTIVVVLVLAFGAPRVGLAVLLIAYTVGRWH